MWVWLDPFPIPDAAPARAREDPRRLRRVRRIARRAGLDEGDAALLDGLARRRGIADPARRLTDWGQCRDLLRRAVDAVQRRPDLTEPDRQHWLACWFRLEARLERRAAGDRRRAHRRRPVERPCIVTPMLTPAGRQAAVLAPHRRIMATILDVSAGGCALHSLAPFAADDAARIDFDLDRDAPVTAMVTARHVRPQRPAGGIVHLRFTSLSCEHGNRIHRYVYGHEVCGDDRTT